MTPPDDAAAGRGDVERRGERVKGAAVEEDFGAAALWMGGAILAFMVMAIGGRELSDDTNTFQIMFWRSLVGLAVVCVALGFSREGFRQVGTRRPGLHGLRNIGHFTGQNCWFYAIGVIPLADVFAIEFTSPIWVALLAPVFLGERFTVWRLLAVALGAVGVLFVTRPGGADFQLGHIVMLIGAVGFAVSLLSTKGLTRSESLLCILFWMTATQAVMALACAVAYGLWVGAPALPTPDGWSALWLGLVGLAGLAAHTCVTSAFRRADASLVAPIDFFRLPMIAFVGAAVYDEPLNPWVFVGGAIILSGNVINLRMERRRSRTGDARRSKGASGA